MSAPLSPIARWAVAAIRAYQRYLSPRKGPVCIFRPTCSEYTAQAILRFGALRGIWLGFTRLLRCNPWTPGGYDPVPDVPPQGPPPPAGDSL
jgi:putative membrane protein insertion efficiency factor